MARLDEDIPDHIQGQARRFIEILKRATDWRVEFLPAGYEGPVAWIQFLCELEEDILKEAFYYFNHNEEEDELFQWLIPFRSMSVGDFVVVTNTETGEKTMYRCDPYGWEKIK